MEKIVNKILAGLIEANEFVTGDVTNGVAIRQFNADGTVTKITAEQFWKSRAELLEANVDKPDGEPDASPHG